MAVKRPPPDASWRDSARSPRFFLVDAKAVFPILLWALHMRWWTFIVACIAIVFFSILNRYGFTVEVFGRWLRSSLAGKRKFSNPWWMH